MKRLLIIIVAAITLAPQIALTQSPEYCAPTERMGKYRFLRQLTLDLYGRIPTIDEYERLHQLADVDEALIDEMLGSTEFFDNLAAYHRGLLWTALPGNDDLFGMFIEPRSTTDNSDADVWVIRDKQQEYRRAYTPCMDTRHTNFDTDGTPLPMDANYLGSDSCDEVTEDGVIVGCRMDGWVEVQPYWAPQTTIKVCAFDAQTANTEEPGTYCSSYDRNPDCGCGDDLLYCAGEGEEGNVDEIRQALTEEPARIIEGIIRSGRPYHEAFTTRDTYFNGALRHYYRYLQRKADGELQTIPGSTYGADWEIIQRPEHHAGILTTMGYLLRFTTQRARVNQLYDKFLCDPFQAPAGGLPPATDPCSQDPNLAERCGCATCHQTIEPATTFFGRWEEGDFEYQGELETFREECAECSAGSGTCRNCDQDGYITRDLETEPGSVDSELGKLKVTAWRTAGEAQAIDQGPGGLMQRPGYQDRMAQCTVQNFSEFLFGRELSTNEKSGWLRDQTTRFANNGHDFLRMAKDLLMEPRYRKVE